jgi:hypothetical protein
LWAGSWAARGKIAVSGTPNCLNYCEIFLLYTQFTNVTAGRIIKSGGPRLEAHVVTNSTNSKTATAYAITITTGITANTTKTTTTTTNYRNLQLKQHNYGETVTFVS